MCNIKIEIILFSKKLFNFCEHNTQVLNLIIKLKEIGQHLETRTICLGRYLNKSCFFKFTKQFHIKFSNALLNFCRLYSSDRCNDICKRNVALCM